MKLGAAPKAQWPLSEWEYHEAVRRSRDALRLPNGQRNDALLRIAADYGICKRTLYRWVKYSVHEVRVGRYVALFVANPGKTPAQVTRWEKAA
jgi:hypothetical protein